MNISKRHAINILNTPRSFKRSKQLENIGFKLKDFEFHYKGNKMIRSISISLLISISDKYWNKILRNIKYEIKKDLNYSKNVLSV
jgi:hypothetical protein